MPSAQVVHGFRLVGDLPGGVLVLKKPTAKAIHRRRFTDTLLEGQIKESSQIPHHGNIMLKILLWL